MTDLKRTSRIGRMVAPLCAVVMLASACASQTAPITDLDRDSFAPQLTGALTTFDSCQQALDELKAKASQYVGPYGFGAVYPMEVDEAEALSDTKAAAPGASADQSRHSDTNVQEVGVDEPDLVKTDGKRIVTIRNGSLYVVDAASRALSGSLKLGEGQEFAYTDGSMLLHGDRALVILPHAELYRTDDWSTREGYVPTQATLMLVDLSGSPSLLNTYVIEGSYLDARAVDGVSRIVVQSDPHLEFEPSGDDPDADTEANRKVIAESTIEDWLPRFQLDGEYGQIPCDALARPSLYSGTSMLTILTFDLSKNLDAGSPVSIAADGQTVYGSPSALYIANDHREFATMAWDKRIWSDLGWEESAEATTELYRFSIGQAGPPVFDSSGTVPGFLLNQYSMSEWDGHLRVATTLQTEFDIDGGGDSSSTVYILALGEETLEQVGKVGNLGEGETIYSVRFMAGTGYVVTFRQTDPLYVLDLSNPSAPTMTGELKITGYSSYLHPISGDRLIGVGQEASTQGVVTGSQVSLFDVSDPTSPGRLDQFHIPDSSSGAEYDPHAFLYWPETSLLVLPVQKYGEYDYTGDVVLLSVGSDSLTEVSQIEHQGTDSYMAGIDRSLIIGETLWTLSPSGMMASSLSDYKELAWVATN